MRAQLDDRSKVNKNKPALSTFLYYSNTYLDKTSRSTGKMTGLNNVDDVCSTVDREQDKFIETTADSELDDDEIDEVFFTIKSKSSSPRVSKSDAEPGINESPNSKSNSTILRRTSKNSLNKQTSLKKFFTKQIPDKQHEHIQPMNESDSDEKKETEKDSDKYNDTLIDSPQSKKRAVLNSISFSDTFDLLSDEAESKVPDEVPLFIDSEPAHFTQVYFYSFSASVYSFFLLINCFNFNENCN